MEDEKRIQPDEDGETIELPEPEQSTLETWSEPESGVISVQEVSMSDIMGRIFEALRGVYDRGVSPKELRKRSGLKKKRFHKIEEMDMTAQLGDVMKVLNAAGMTLVVLPIEEAERLETAEAAQTPGNPTEPPA